MNKEIKFAVVGAGLIAPFHLNAIKDAQGAIATGVFDIAQDRCAEMAKKFGIKAYGSLDELLNDDVDVVCVATPNHLHKDIVIAAAKKGKHILTEKPPAMTLKETDEMIAACEQAGVKFGCFVQCRVRKAIQAIKTALEQGRFGKLLHADAYMKWFRPQEYYTSDGWRGQKKSGSGVTVAQGFHYLDLLRYIAGEAVSVEAKMENIAHPGVSLEDDVIAHIEYANEAKGVVQLSTAIWPGTDIRIEINGTDGTAVMIGERVDTWKFKDERKEDEEIKTYGSASQATGASGAADIGHSDHTVVVADMAEAINNNREVIIPVRSVRATIEIVLAMYQSAKKGRKVQFPISDDDGVWQD